MAPTLLFSQCPEIVSAGLQVIGDIEICAGDTITIQNESYVQQVANGVLTPPDIVIIEWGDLSIDTLQNQEFYSKIIDISCANEVDADITSDGFKIRITIRAIAICDDDTWKEHENSSPVFVIPEPNAQFTFNNNLCNEELSVNFFYDTCPLEFIDSVRWNFGDGGLSNEINPEYFYQTPGIYTVTLTTWNKCGEDIHEIEVPVTTFPIVSADLIYDENECVPLSITIDASNSIYADNYLLTILQDGVVLEEISQDNPIFSNQIQTVGNYEFIVTAQNNCGIDELSISESFESAILGNLNAIDEICTSTPIDLSNYNIFPSTLPTNIMWDIEGGTPSTSNDVFPSIVYQTAGTYTLSATFESCNGQMETISQIVTVSELISIELTELDTLCLGESINLNNIQTSNIPGVWEINEVTINESIFSPPNAGVYNIVFIDTICFQKDTIQLIVSDVGFFETNIELCINDLSINLDSIYACDWQNQIFDPSQGVGSYNLECIELLGNCPSEALINVNVVDREAVLLIEGMECIADDYIFPSNSLVEITNNSNDPTFSIQIDGDEISNDNSTSYLFSNPGVYEILLIVGIDNGCKDSVSQVITIEADLVMPEMEMQQEELCEGIELSYNISDTLDHLMYEWNLPDGNSYHSAIPPNIIVPHSINDTTYIVQLTVTSNCSSVTLIDSVYVTKSVLSSEFYIDGMIEGCTPLEVNFIPNFNAVDSFVVVYGNGIINTNEFPPEEYINNSDSIQNFTVTVYGFDFDCQEIDTFQQEISVFPSEVAVGFTIFTPITGCSPLSVDGQLIGLGGDNYFVFSGNGTMLESEPNDSITFEYTNFSDSIQYFNLKVIGIGCGTDTTIVPITVYPQTPVEINHPNDICLNDTVLFFLESSTEISNYSLSFGDGESYGADDLDEFVKHKYQTSGSYLIHLNVTNPFGCITEANSNIIINEYEGLSIDAIINPLETCIGIDVDVTINSSASDYSINFGNQVLYDEPMASYQFSEVGIHNIYTRQYDNNGCYIEELTPITINPIPSIFIAQEDDTVCFGQQITLEVISDAVIKEVKWEGENIFTDTLKRTNVMPTNISGNNLYFVTITTDQECTAESSTNIKVENKKQIFFPNTFTPNADGNNDLFFPQTYEGIIHNILDFQVFSRWGNEVFHNSNFLPNIPDNGWDGVFKGKIAQQGVYVYVCKVEFIDGVIETFYGDITLLR